MVLSCFLLSKIVDDKGNECPAGVEGEIVVKISPKRPVGIFSRYVVSCQKSFVQMLDDI